MNENIEELMNSIINFCNRTSYYILIFFINIGTMLNSIGISIKSFIISDSLDDLIYNIEYIDHIHYIKKTIYNLSIFDKFCLLFNNNRLEFNINNNTKNEIKKLINFYDNGYLKINYYDKNEEKKIIINLELFKKTNFLFKYVDLIICNVIQNFIKNNVVYPDRNILYTELKYKNKTTDITTSYKGIKDSLKMNNITPYDLLLLLNTDICDLNNLENINHNDLSLIVTDGDLEETIFESSDYINYKTLYEEIAEKKTG